MFENILEYVVGIVHLVGIVPHSQRSPTQMEDRCGLVQEPALTCGTHFGDTNEPASIVESPVLARRWMSSILVASGMVVFSFCRPSRGPTSTILTRLSKAGRLELDALLPAVAKPRRLRPLVRRKQRRTIGDRIAMLMVEIGHRPEALGRFIQSLR